MRRMLFTGAATIFMVASVSGQQAKAPIDEVFEEIGKMSAPVGKKGISIAGVRILVHAPKNKLNLIVALDGANKLIYATLYAKTPQTSQLCLPDCDYYEPVGGNFQKCWCNEEKDWDLVNQFGYAGISGKGS